VPAAAICVGCIAPGADPGPFMLREPLPFVPAEQATRNTAKLTANTDV
jgi:hypothetical protein